MDRLVGIAADRSRITRLLLSSAGVTAGYIPALAASLYACGARVGFAEVAAAYLAGSAVAAASPTPGGLGAVEAALVAAHPFRWATRAVVAGVLTFRLLTTGSPRCPAFSPSGVFSAACCDATLPGHYYAFGGLPAPAPAAYAALWHQPRLS